MEINFTASAVTELSLTVSYPYSNVTAWEDRPFFVWGWGTFYDKYFTILKSSDCVFRDLFSSSGFFLVVYFIGVF